MSILFLWLVSVSCVDLTVATLPCKCSYFCIFVDFIVQHSPDTHFIHVPVTIFHYASRQEYFQSQLNVAFSDLERGSLYIINVHPCPLAHLATIFFVLNLSTIDHSSYGRIPLAPSYFSLNSRLRHVLVQVSACMSMPRTSGVIVAWD